MNLLILKSSIVHRPSSITIAGSKSESNRWLLLQALYPEIQIMNLSNSDDSHLMKRALNQESTRIDIHHAGTAMRFLTAYFATQQENEVILTGSSRMKERPIEILVTALNSLGADISYLENSGYPPLKIIGKSITNNKAKLKANVSSQYISALLLIAPKLKNGLELSLGGNITSAPYLNMTLALLNEIGVETSCSDTKITVKHKAHISRHQAVIESDWSSASYFFSMVALSKIGTEIKLSSFKKHSLQADALLPEIYKNFGLSTKFEKDTIILQKTTTNQLQSLSFNLQSSPDIAQTIAVTCFGIGIGCHLTGLRTLKIKETDRLLALKTELEKLGGNVKITNDSLELESHGLFKEGVHYPSSEIPMVATYNDHRMAMALAPLALKIPLQIQNAKVVSKSYPAFWDDLKSIGFKISE